MTSVAPPTAPSPLEWRCVAEPVEYETALCIMQTRIAEISAGSSPELVWLLEHPPLYTAGTGASGADLLAPDRFPVHRTGRGGRYTYHGPGQRVVYVMLDVRRRYGADIARFVADLEGWIIAALAHLGVAGRNIKGRTGVWVETAPGKSAKIAAIGLRITRGVSWHGLAINVAPDLEHFAGIVPCGIADAEVTSLERLGVAASLAELDAALRATFARHVREEPAPPRTAIG